jgi:hypothetical protein
MKLVAWAKSVERPGGIDDGWKAGRSLQAPMGVGVQVPTLPASEQLAQASGTPVESSRLLQRESQQTPSTQNPEEHSASREHVAESDFAGWQ